MLGYLKEELRCQPDSYISFSAFFSAVLGGFLHVPVAVGELRRFSMERLTGIYIKSMIAVKGNKNLFFNLGESIESNLVEVSFLSLSFGVF